MTSEEHAKRAREALKEAALGGMPGIYYVSLANAHATLALYEQRREEKQHEASLGRLHQR